VPVVRSANRSSETSIHFSRIRLLSADPTHRGSAAVPTFQYPSGSRKVH
jgi:hypothetical protein